MYKFSLGIKAPINGIYLNSETIELLSIIQCKNIAELRDFVRNCSQLNISEQEIQNLEESSLESIKRNLVEQYKKSLIPMEQSIKDRRSVLESTLIHSGLPSKEIDSYISVFQAEGYEGIRKKLKDEHPENYAEFTEKAHRFIASERDQMRNLTYEELSGINDILAEHNTVLVASGRYYDVTKKMYDEKIPNIEKYDFYYAKRGLDFCHKNGMHARYHTLLDKQTMEEHLNGRPKEEVLKELQEYVKHSIDFISKYNEEHKIDGKGVITSVDLFNEIISFDPPYRNMWKELHGISNEDLADIFQYAVENKPEGITYVYNEPFLENPERRQVVLKQLEEINALCPGLIDTIGTQMHIEMTQSLEDVRNCFEDLKKAGVNIQITEFDMCLPERFMFDKNGKTHSESEILDFINQRTGMTIKSIAELKEMRINGISRAIKETDVPLEGITYWSISDTLDHNLERTNKKTIEDGLPRDMATTRYAGLYSDFRREPEQRRSINMKVLRKAYPCDINWNEFSMDIPENFSGTFYIYVDNLTGNIQEDLEKIARIKSVPGINEVVISSSDFRVAKYFDLLLKDFNNIKKFNLLNDREFKDRSYIDFVQLAYDEVTVPFDYIMYGIKPTGITSYTIANIRRGNIIIPKADYQIAYPNIQNQVESIIDEIFGQIPMEQLDDIDKSILVSNWIQRNIQFIEGKISYVNGKKFICEEYSATDDRGDIMTAIDKHLGVCNAIAKLSVALLSNPKVGCKCNLACSPGHVYFTQVIDNEMYATDTTWCITRNPHHMGESLKSSSFSDEYLLIGEDKINEDQTTLFYHTQNCIFKGNISERGISKERIRQSIEKLKSFGVSFDYDEPPIFVQHEEKVPKEMIR